MLVLVQLIFKFAASLAQWLETERLLEAGQALALRNLLLTTAKEIADASAVRSGVSSADLDRLLTPPDQRNK